MLIDEFIRKLPKAELNIHLEGCLTPELILEFAKRNKIALPFNDAKALAQSYQFKDLKSFLEVYYDAQKVLVTADDFYELTMSYLAKAAEQNIRHVELQFDPQAHISRGVAFDTVIKGIERAIKEAENKFGISTYLILCFMRNLSEQNAESVFEQALAYKELFVAVSLDSAELNNPPEKFKAVFEKALNQGFLTVAIAGETGPPEYIWQAIDELHVSRIDHGVRCMEDPDLVTRLAAKQIPLDVCPISNVRLGVVPNMRQHPLKNMYEEGLFVTVNSDDPAFFNAYLNENFVAANAALKLNKAIIYELIKNSFYASFLDHTRKEKLINELDKAYKQASLTQNQ